LKILYGGIAGFLAAIPMSVTMGVLFRMLPRRLRYAASPREITLVVAEKTGLDEQVDEEPEATLATGAAHFGYSALGGAIYAATAHRMNLHPLLKGYIFSLLFWAFGYLGWLPALQIQRPVTDHPARRTAVMIAAHLVWGITIAQSLERLRGRSSGEMNEIET
jgi:uncharacterized membrane protein YagU involved in acid resistance